jgi:hypothetical protein
VNNVCAGYFTTPGKALPKAGGDDDFGVIPQDSTSAPIAKSRPVAGLYVVNKILYKTIKYTILIM